MQDIENTKLNQEKKLQEDFSSIKSCFKPEFVGSKIYFVQQNEILEHLLAILTFFIYAMIIALTSIGKPHSKGDPMNIVTGLFFLICYTIIRSFFKYGKVIDLENNQVYTELKIFNIPFNYNHVNKNQIKIITNNTIVSIKNPAGKNGSVDERPVILNDKTNLFHKHYLSFLLEDGTIYNFIELGYFQEDYESTKLIVNKLSNIWNLPKYDCQDTHSLTVNYVSGNYELSDVKISYIPNSIKIISFFVFLLTILFISVILAIYEVNMAISLIVLIILIFVFINII